MARLTLCLALVAVLAAPAAAQSGRIFGSLTDETGAVLPGVEVRASLRDQSGETLRSVVTDSKGSYTLDGLTPGQWAVTTSLPGFETATRRQAVQIGDAVEWSPTLELGMLQETITITTATSNEPARTVSPVRPEPTAATPIAPAAPRPAQAATPVRVGGNVKPPRKIVNVNPIYPSDAAAQGIAGVVILRATVDVDGTVRNVETLRSSHDSLTSSATNAIVGWEFTPTLLNGVPVPVRMTATFNFAQN
jgi:TonB family protein